MPDAIQESVQRQDTEIKRQSPQLSSLRLESPLFTETKKLTDEARLELGRARNTELNRLSFTGTTTDAYINTARTEVFKILKQDDPRVVAQFRNQVAFYTKYSDNPAFIEIAVPMTGTIEDKTGAIIGTEMPYYGMSLSEFKTQGNSLTKAQIDIFVEKYNTFMTRSGIPHGDFAFRQNPEGLIPANWDSLRVDGAYNLRFIDYNGRNRGIAYGNETVYPDGSTDVPPAMINQQLYEELFHSESQRTKEALYQFFKLPVQSVDAMKTTAEYHHNGRLALIRSLLKKYL